MGGCWFIVGMTNQGMDTREPLLGVDQYIFEGRHEEVIGTNLFFYMEGNELREGEDVLKRNTCRKLCRDVGRSS